MILACGYRSRVTLNNEVMEYSMSTGSDHTHKLQLSVTATMYPVHCVYDVRMYVRMYIHVYVQTNMCIHAYYFTWYEKHAHIHTYAQTPAGRLCRDIKYHA